MADRKIRIHLAASADLAALQAALASAREWATFGGAADGAACPVAGAPASAGDAAK